MFLIHLSRTALRQVLVRLLLVWLMFSVLALSTLSAWGQAAGGMSPAPGSGIVWKICDPPPICLESKAAKEKWAKDHQCRFIEDVCEERGKDNQGAPPGDKGFWGGLWQSIKSNLVYGYNFVRGIFEGMKGQVADLINLISNPAEVISGLVELGKAFYNDPKGTVQKIGELLGQEAVDALTKATRCGAYDLGKVIGQYVSPAVALKLASRLTRYAGKLGDAVRSIKVDVGCASFALGTLVMTPNGAVRIEQVSVGQLVDSRNDSSFAEKPREVQQTFSRLAPSHRLLHTEAGTLTLTDEHPLWVQGKGWTEAREVVIDDVVAGQRGDILVTSNEVVRRALRVHNFSVATTPNYFVGPDGIWVHNAKCSLPVPYKATPSPSKYRLGASDGGPGVWVKVNRGNSSPAAYKFEKQVTGAPPNIEYEVKGVKFDGYDSKTGTLIDAKNYSDSNLLLNESLPKLKRNVELETLEVASRQVAAAGNTPIEYHVSNQKAVIAIQKLFESDYSQIKVIYTPDIVN